MLKIFRFSKFLAKPPSNAIPWNSKLRMMSSEKDGENCSGNNSESKEKPEPETDSSASKKKKKPNNCEELLMKKVKKLQVDDLTAIQGGGKRTGCPSPKKPPPGADYTGGIWKKISLFVAIPIIAILSVKILSTHSEGDRPEFVYYPHLYKRVKPYWFRDGNRTAFHNEHWNALPPDGYEDEFDLEGKKQTETDDEKKQRLKEFEETRKDWVKHDKKREKQRQKEEEIARKQQLKEAKAAPSEE